MTPRAPVFVPRRTLVLLLAVVLFSIGVAYVVFLGTFDHPTRVLWGLLFGGLDAVAVAFL